MFDGLASRFISKISNIGMTNINEGVVVVGETSGVNGLVFTLPPAVVESPEAAVADAGEDGGGSIVREPEM